MFIHIKNNKEKMDSIDGFSYWETYLDIPTSELEEILPSLFIEMNVKKDYECRILKEKQALDTNQKVSKKHRVAGPTVWVTLV